MFYSWRHGTGTVLREHETRDLGEPETPLPTSPLGLHDRHSLMILPGPPDNAITCQFIDIDGGIDMLIRFFAVTDACWPTGVERSVPRFLLRDTILLLLISYRPLIPSHIQAIMLETSAGLAPSMRPLLSSPKGLLTHQIRIAALSDLPCQRIESRVFNAAFSTH